MQDVYTALQHYDACVLLGSGGSGKTRIGQSVHRLAVNATAETACARVANSGLVAVNAGCDTFGRRLQYGKYDARRSRPYCDAQSADAAAAIKFMVVEEATAIPDRLLTAHLCAVKHAKVQANESVAAYGGVPHANVEGPFGGMKVLMSGDHLQSLTSRGGVGRVLADGVALAWQPPPHSCDDLWRTAPFKHPEARVLVMVVHGNHRLKGMMHKLHATGCVFST